jgi:uncharacterized membrane protein YeiH
MIQPISFDILFDYLGSFAFCLSGASLGSTNKMDFFGIYVLAVIAGFGGGCLRDVILGIHPPVLFNTPIYWLIALIATCSSFIPFPKKRKLLPALIYAFDGLGLAFFTIVGIKAGIAQSLHPYQCIIMGVMTACFGGVLRDIIVNRIPYVFHKEVYASLSIAGGVLFFILQPYIKKPYVEFIIIGLIFSARLIVRRLDLHLPSAKNEY